MLAVALLTGPVAGRSGSLYPMEGGDLARSNRALQPSSVHGPLDLQWRKPIFASYSVPLGHPILLSDRKQRRSFLINPP